MYGIGGGGTGFQVESSTGTQFTMTNRHICDGVAQSGAAKWEDSEGNEGIIKVIYRDEHSDLCLMEPVLTLPALKTAKRIFPKEKIYLIGHPGLRDLTFQEGRYVGGAAFIMASRCYKNHMEFCLDMYYANYINAISYGGNSGSPVLDRLGNVVGVLFAGRRGQPTASYMVRLSDVLRVLDLY